MEKKSRYIAYLCFDELSDSLLSYLKQMSEVLGRSVLLINNSYQALRPIGDGVVVSIPSFWSDVEQLHELLDDYDISFLVLGRNPGHISLRKALKKLLNLRIPYMFLPNDLDACCAKWDVLILPIRTLPEDKELGVFASPLARKLRAKVRLVLARAYSSRVATTSEQLKSLFKKQQLTHDVVQGNKYSEKIAAESLKYRVREESACLLMSASRAYGLDDLFWGPPEWHILRKSIVPVMLINPRGDLYVLCD